MSKPRKRGWDRLNTSQLAAATAEFERSMTIDATRRMTAAERATWKAAKRRLAPTPDVIGRE